MDADEWRVVVAAGDAEDATRVAKALHRHEPGEEALDRVAVTRDGAHVFLYAADRAGAEAAQSAARHVLDRERLTADVTAQRWHHGEERWESGDAVVDEPAERATLEADERRETAQEGAEWEVRVDLGGHRAAVELAERLRADGLPVWRGWRFLIVGAASEQDAHELAERIRAEAPAGARIQAEGAPGFVARVARRANPYTPF
jgi:hypothetical protein